MDEIHSNFVKCERMCAKMMESVTNDSWGETLKIMKNFLNPKKMHKIRKNNETLGLFKRNKQKQ